VPDHEDPPTHVLENERYWDGMADGWVASGERRWELAEPIWGNWGVAEAELGLLPADMTGSRAVELGCGTGYVSAWMARRGAAVTGIDASERQLATARRLAERHGVPLTLVHGDAEATPFEDGAFDFAISEYGAATWCDPYRWIPEAYRLLRPGGRLVFLGMHPLALLCAPADGSAPLARSLERPYFGLHRLDWTGVEQDPGGIEFNLPIAAWFALFRRVGFAVEDFREPQPAAGAEAVSPHAGLAWARAWPAEQVWKLRRPG
jgi:SAM-dependent methyltransferase